MPPDLGLFYYYYFYYFFRGGLGSFFCFFSPGLEAAVPPVRCARVEMGAKARGGGGDGDEAWKAALPPAPAAPGTMATGSVGTMPGGAELLGLQDTSTTASATPGPAPPGLWENAWLVGGVAPNLGKVPPRGPPRPIPAFGAEPVPVCAANTAEGTGGAQQVGTGQPRCPALRSLSSPFFSTLLQLPPPHPSHPHPPAGLPPSPSPPHYFCYHKAASVPKRRHVRGKQSAIVRSLGTRGGGAEGARGPPPAAPRPGRSDAIVMEIAFPHAVELDVDSFSLGLHVSPATCLWENFLSGSSVKLINQGLEMAMGHKRGQPGETPANSQKPPGVYSPGLPGRRCPARRPR